MLLIEKGKAMGCRNEPICNKTAGASAVFFWLLFFSSIALLGIALGAIAAWWYREGCPIGTLGVLLQASVVGGLGLVFGAFCIASASLLRQVFVGLSIIIGVAVSTTGNGFLLGSFSVDLLFGVIAARRIYPTLGRREWLIRTGIIAIGVLTIVFLMASSMLSETAVSSWLERGQGY